MKKKMIIIIGGLLLVTGGLTVRAQYTQPEMYDGDKNGKRLLNNESETIFCCCPASSIDNCSSADCTNSVCRKYNK